MAPSTNELVARFRDRFAGLDRVHGCTELKSAGADGAKQAARSWLTREPPTDETWLNHLEGRLGIGVVPIRDDATCSWGAIDVDRYDLDLQALEVETRRLRLPLIVCRSKSGGAHLFLFLKVPVSAELARERLMSWAVALGYGGVEVFPKQSRLASSDDVGNWLNLPYFNSLGKRRTVRYALRDGAMLPLEGFLDLADKFAITEAQLKKVKIPRDESFEERWHEAPPCLETLAVRGFPEGTRNNALFNVAVYLRERYPDDWTTRVDGYNQAFMSPPLGHKEVEQIVKSARRKNYYYRCKDHPIQPVCNRQICLARRYGVGSSEGELNVALGSITVLPVTPPTYILDVDGRRIHLTTEDLMSQARFQRRCIEEIQKWPASINRHAWQKLVNEKLQTAERLEVPYESTAEGEFWALVEEFCTGRLRGRSREELLDGKPYTNGGRTYFQLSSFRRYLQNLRYPHGAREITRHLKEREDTETGAWNVKGKFVRWWSVPSFPEQTEPTDLPDLPQEGDF